MDATPWVPKSRSLRTLRKAADGCRGCPLWEKGTQTVFGTGLAKARLFFVGEQPGNKEDELGQPFVGPAGKLLDGALADAGIDRSACYLTNAVKHFKWKARGQRHMHDTPSAREAKACQPWLEAELSAVRPEMVICLGATAVRSLLGSRVRVLRDRGREFSSSLAPRVWITIHPSLLLRMPDRREAEQEYDRFVRELSAAARAATSPKA